MKVSGAKAHTNPIVLKTAPLSPKSVSPREMSDSKAQKIAEELLPEARRWVSNVDLKKQLTKYGEKAITQTIKSCEKIWRFKSEIKLNTHQLFKIVLYIETKLKKNIEKGHYYLNKKNTGLSRTIEHDPKTNRTFIHLTKSLGSGTHKTVTISLLYDHHSPKLAANASTSEKIADEVKVHKKFRHMKGLAHTYAITQHIDKKTKKKMTSILLQFYNAHSVRHYQYHRDQLTKKEELIIARDLLYGLENMHKQDRVHRDMHGANFLVDRKIDPETQRESLSAVIIDFGRTIRKDKAAKKGPWMPTKQINPPETFSTPANKLNYKALDVYALGCQLFHLHYGKQPDLPSKEEFAHAMRGIHASRYAFRHVLSKKIKKFRAEIKKEVADKESHHKATPHDLYKNIIAQMCNTNPTARGTAHELRKKVEELLQQM